MSDTLAATRAAVRALLDETSDYKLAGLLRSVDVELERAASQHSKSGGDFDAWWKSRGPALAPLGAEFCARRAWLEKPESTGAEVHKPGPSQNPNQLCAHGYSLRDSCPVCDASGGFIAPPSEDSSR